ncbi:MAG: hypothetical protein KC613_13965, partial [Myxococcales bacterium]|nr:hypothetical protein [Myxococcales bacterium]
MRPVSSVSRHATSACLCLWVLACSPPIDADRCFDERCPPGTACVAGRCEASLTPDQDPPTADQGPDDGPDGGPDCTPIRPLTSAEPEALWASDLEEIARFGVPAPPEGFGAADLDGDGLADSVAVVGDRIQATDGARSLRWAVDAGGATALGGVVDLDGDGRLEVIAFGEGALQILDGLTGATVWALDVGGQRKALDGFQAVDVVRVGPRSAGGQRPVLVTDHGCGQQVGTTQAAILWLSEGAVTEVPLDLDSLVCARGAVFGRPGPQAELGVLLPTGNRLQQISQFDPHTGALRWCGRLPNGGTPRLQVVEVLPDRPGLEVLAHDSEGWLVYAAVEGAWVDCGQGGVVGPARSDFTDLFAGDPVVVFDPDGDGRPEIAGTALFDEETVYVGRPDPMAGEPADFAQIFGRRLVGAGYGPDDLILWRRPDPDFFFQLGATERVIFDDGDPGTVWGPREHTRPARLTGPGGPPDRDPEGERPVWLRHPDGARLILEGDGDADGVVDHLLAVDAAGDVVGRRPVAGAPVAYQVVCEASACDTTDGLLVLTADGDVQALSAALAPAAAKAGGPPAPPVAGAITLRLTPDDEPTLVVGVQASAADPRYVRVVGQDPLSGHRWSLPLDFETLPPVVLPHPDLGARVAVRQVQGRTVTWRVLDPVSGAELWEHTVRNRQVAPAPLVPLPAGDGSLVLRLDAPTGSPQEGCPQAVLPPADPGGCAVVPPNRRVTALDVADGTCRWQLDYTLSTPCAANLEAALERLSVVPGEGDTLELYLTESTAVHRLAPSTGAWLGSASLAPPGQGGALLRHPRVDLRLRLGAGPVDLW